MFDCHDGLYSDGYCECGDYCWEEDYWDPDPDGDRPPDGYGWCDSSEDCGPDEICAPFGQCMALVLGCPLTEECLPDPEGYVPDWMGIDPTYVGEFTVEDSQVRLIVNLDFYEDHLYGEGFGEIWSEYGYWEGYNFAVTGSRDGAQLWGQVIETDGFGRTFDLVFEAQLLSASEIVGTFSLSGDEGQVDGEYTLYRTSPCGCDEIPCQEDADCPEGQVCQDGECVDDQEQPCTENADCEPGQVCLNGECIDA
jgi:Cys-rich repeat protein